MFRKMLMAAVVAAGMPAAAYAAPITPTVTTTPGTAYNTTAMSNYKTLAANMVGSIVTVTFANGTSNSATWTAAGALNTGWTLSIPGDTYSALWSFANVGSKAITGFTFNGVPGNTSFDIVPAPTVDSPGSSYGAPFSQVSGPSTLAVSALYSNQLLVNGKFYGDEYTKLAVTFGGTGLGAGQTLSFRADADNASITALPEPAAWTMMIVGMGFVGGALRRRVRSSEAAFDAKIKRIAAGAAA